MRTPISQVTPSLYTLSSSIDARVIGVCLGARWYLIGMVPRLHFLVPDAYLLYTHCGYVLHAFINTTSSTRIFNRETTRNRAPDSKSHMVFSQGSCGQQRMGMRDDGSLLISSHEYSSPAMFSVYSYVSEPLPWHHSRWSEDTGIPINFILLYGHFGCQ